MIERVYWTTHAELRLSQRGLQRGQIERAIRDGHGRREVNVGDADWRTHSTSADGRSVVVIYDHPVFGDPKAARVVTAWVVRN